MDPAITHRAAYQLSRKTVPVFITGALELRDPLLKIADIKGRGAALAFTAIEEQRGAPEQVKKMIQQDGGLGAPSMGRQNF